MSVSVRVPASTSNLGGGFDCVGMAVDRWLTLTAALTPAPRGSDTAGVTITRDGALRSVMCAPEADLIVRGFAAACAHRGRALPHGVLLHATSEIPVGRGLGSSAAALVAGAAAANVLLGLDLDDDALLALCAGLEGHADNVAPAIRGGATLVVHAAGGAPYAAPLEVHPSLRFAFAVPELTVDTSRARAALPPSLAHEEARRGAAAAAALVRGLATGDPALLAAGFEGPLHIPYRRPLVPGYDAVTAAALAAGAAAATLSGSGSSIVAVASAEAAPRVAAAMEAAWRAEGITATSFLSAPCDRGYRATPVARGPAPVPTPAD